MLFRVSPIVIEVLKDGVISDLSVSYQGKPITSGLRAYQIAIWNAGREPIRHEDVLKPLKLGWSSNVSIVEAKIPRQTREETGFSIVSIDRTKREIAIDWKILENGDGAMLQLLVQGNDLPEFVFSGTVVGQDRIEATQRAPSGKRAETKRLIWLDRGLTVLFSCCFLFFTLALTKVTYDACRARPIKVAQLLVFVVMLLFLLAILALMTVALIDTFKATSPFDF
ncbi:MAG: hypothetical protein ABL985_07445 [Casimicrobium sp.]